MIKIKKVIKNFIKYHKLKSKIKKYQKNGNIIKVNKKDILKVELNLDDCYNNYIEIKQLNSNCGKIIISLYADNSNIIIDEHYYTISTRIVIGQNHPNFGKITNSNLYIGGNTTSENDFVIFTHNSHSNIKIGNNCMFARNVTIVNTDAHPIYDLTTKQIINKVGTLEIQDNVWIGINATILKNCFIPKGCIVGMGSVVTKKFNNTNCIIAGNPAKIIKENIYWKSNGSQGYIQNSINFSSIS